MRRRPSAASASPSPLAGAPLRSATAQICTSDAIQITDRVIAEVKALSVCRRQAHGHVSVPASFLDQKSRSLWHKRTHARKWQRFVLPSKETSWCAAAPGPKLCDPARACALACTNCSGGGGGALLHMAPPPCTSASRLGRSPLCATPHCQAGSACFADSPGILLSSLRPKAYSALLRLPMQGMVHAQTGQNTFCICACRRAMSLS